MRSAMMKMLVVGALVLPMAGLTACKRGGTVAEEGTTPRLAEPVMIAKSVTGSNELLARPGAMLFQSQADLDAAGAGELFPGEINFDEYDLVVLAGGEVPTGGYWVRITSVSTLGEELYVNGVANKPGEDESVTQAIGHPYHAVLVAKTGATVAIPDVTSVSGQSPNE